MIQRFKAYCQYTLLGMYIITLKKQSMILKMLPNVCVRLLGIKPDEYLEPEDRESTLTALQYYLEELPDIELKDTDINVWGSKQDLLLVIIEELKLGTVALPF